MLFCNLRILMVHKLNTKLILNVKKQCNESTSTFEDK